MSNQKDFNLTWEEYFCKLLEDNLDLPWKWKWISINQNLTFEFVKRHKKKKLNFLFLSNNSFNAEKEKFEKEQKNYIVQNCFPEHIPFEIRIKIIDLV